MVWLPMAGGTVQRVKVDGKPASGYILKLYAAGTSTNIPLATSSTGGTQANYATYNALGDITVSGVTIIPYIDQDYKYSIYPTLAAAEANTGAVLTIDNVIYDESQHVVDVGNYTEINVDNDSTFGDSITVADTTHTNILKEKWVRLTISSGALTVDLSLATYFIYDNTENHTITLTNLPVVSDGYARTFAVIAENADAFTTIFATTGYDLIIRSQDQAIVYAGEVMYVCSIYKAGKVFIGVQNDIEPKV